MSRPKKGDWALSKYTPYFYVVIEDCEDNNTTHCFNLNLAIVETLCTADLGRTTRPEKYS